MTLALIDQYTEEELRNIVATSYSIKEVVRKLGYSTTSGNNSNTVKNRIQKYNIDTSHFISHPNQQKREVGTVFCKNSTASQATLRRWYLKGDYTPYECSICGQGPLWQDKELTLILDHINGCNTDDRLENLRWVCPNCNQQLDTTGYKKIKVPTGKKEKKYYCSNCGKEISNESTTGLCHACAAKMTRVCERPNRETLKNMIRTMPFTEIGKKYNVTDGAIRKWCDSMSLPRKKTDIMKYTDEEWELV
ncbi:MAG: HNH endonuclease [Prevotella sp.]|nr:HNH endonuclease [Prevotella sp.]